MTKEQAKELLPVIHAWVEGKVIEFKRFGQCGWLIADGHAYDFNWDGCEWRIKPTPREWSACLKCHSLRDHFKGCLACGHDQLIKVREVQE